MKYVEHATDHPSQAELLSALHDGQLDAVSAAALVKASLADDSLMQQWRSMSAISTALHTAQPFGQVAIPSPSSPVAPTAPVLQPEAANDGLFRWKMVAGIAALAAVGSIIWGVAGSSAVAPNGPVLAQQAPASNALSAAPQVIAVTAPVSTSSPSGQEPQVMIRDPRLDELLAAHRQFGGHSALQQPAGSLRSVSVVSTRP